MAAEMTALELNNKIVKMRPVIGQVKCIVNRKLIQKMKAFKDKKGTDEQKQKNLKKAERFHEEIQASKRLKPDDISKFALLNTKSFADFGINIDTPAEKRILYKLVSHKILVDTVDEFRGKFPKWHQEIPFHLQRLGRQYQNKPKKERQGKAAATGANSELPQDKSDAEMEANQSDSDTVENEAVGEKQEDKTDVEMKSAEEKALTTAGKPNEAKMEERKKPKFTSAVVDSVIKEELSKVKVPSKKQLKKKMKAKEKKPAEKSQPIIPALPVLPEVKRIPVEANATKGAAVIKKIDLSSEKWFEENTEKSQPMQITKPNAVIKDKFFVAPGGENEDDDESGGDDSWDEAVDNNDFLVKESLKLRKERDSLREGVGKKMRSHFCTSLKEPKATEDFDSKKKSYEREGMTQGRRHERPREDQKKWKPPAARERHQQQPEMHPSWEAKRRQKEKEGFVAPKGKKKVFAD